MINFKKFAKSLWPSKSATPSDDEKLKKKQIPISDDAESSINHPNQYSQVSTGQPLPETPEEKDTIDGSSPAPVPAEGYGMGSGPEGLQKIFAIWNRIQAVVPLKKIYNPLWGAFCICGVGVFNGSMMVLLKNFCFFWIFLLKLTKTCRFPQDLRLMSH